MTSHTRLDLDTGLNHIHCSQYQTTRPWTGVRDQEQTCFILKFMTGRQAAGAPGKQKYFSAYKQFGGSEAGWAIASRRGCLNWCWLHCCAHTVHAILCLHSFVPRLHVRPFYDMFSFTNFCLTYVLRSLKLCSVWSGLDNSRNLDVGLTSHAIFGPTTRRIWHKVRE